MSAVGRVFPLRRAAARSPAPIVIPGDARTVAEIASRCRRLVLKRSLMSAGAVLVPVPGLDVAADVALLVRLIEEVNREFGLTPDQISRIESSERVLVYKAVASFGTALVGRMITPALVVRALAAVGRKVTVKGATKFVPVIGQGVAAGLSFAAMRYVGLSHVRDCERVWLGMLGDDDPL